jgi:hypothetical protein
LGGKGLHVAQCKHFDINWAKVVASIVKEKAHRVAREKMKSSYSSKNGEEMSFKTKGDVACKRSLATLGLHLFLFT